MTGRYVYYIMRFTVAHCQIFILKKTDLTGFFIIKSIHPSPRWIKKTDLDEKNSNGALLLSAV